MDECLSVGDHGEGQTEDGPVSPVYAQTADHVPRGSCKILHSHRDLIQSNSANLNSEILILNSEI